MSSALRGRTDTPRPSSTKRGLRMLHRPADPELDLAAEHQAALAFERLPGSSA